MCSFVDLLFFKSTWGVYVGIPTLAALVAFAFWTNRWQKKTDKKIREKYNREFFTEKNREVFYSVDNDLIFSETSCVQDIIAPVFFSIETNSYETFQKDIARFTKEQVYIAAIQFYDSEVNNGGHFQFFINSTGIYWEEAIAGLQAIGATILADNLKKACDRFSPHPPFDREERIKTVEALHYDFSQEDDEYYQNAGNLEELEMNYIRANAQQFLLLSQT